MFDINQHILSKLNLQLEESKSLFKKYNDESKIIHNQLIEDINKWFTSFSSISDVNVYLSDNNMNIDNMFMFMKEKNKIKIRFNTDLLEFEKDKHILSTIKYIIDNEETIISFISDIFNKYNKIYSKKVECNDLIEGIKHGINKIKNNIINSQMDEYKKVGFEHNLKKYKCCEHNCNNDAYELVEKSPTDDTIRLNVASNKRGRPGFYNRKPINYYKVVEYTNDNKVKLEVKYYDYSTCIKVPIIEFEAFVKGVVDWETNECDRISETNIKSYNEKTKTK